MAIITLAAYANTFRVPFQFDDAPNIVSNPSIRFKTLSVEWFDKLIKLNNDSIRVFSYLLSPLTITSEGSMSSGTISSTSSSISAPASCSTGFFF